MALFPDWTLVSAFYYGLSTHDLVWNGRIGEKKYIFFYYSVNLRSSGNPKGDLFLSNLIHTHQENATCKDLLISCYYKIIIMNASSVIRALFKSFLRGERFWLKQIKNHALCQ